MSVEATPPQTSEENTGQVVAAESRLRLRSLGIDPKKLLYFATVVELGSFNKASHVLGVCQPALSTSMMRLEAELGVKLVNRGARGVTPTHYGDMLYSHSRMIRDELLLAERNLLNNLDNMPTRFGCLPSLGSNVVPTAISQWRKQNAHRDLRVVEAVQFDLLNGLLRRELDVFVGFTENYQLIEGLRQRVLFRDRLAIVARPGHPLFSKTEITLKSLVGFAWVFLPSGPFNMGFEEQFERAGIRLLGGNTVCNSIAMMKTLVSRDDHLALMPCHTVENELADGRIAIIPFTMPSFDRSIAVFTRENVEIDAPTRSLIEEIQVVGSRLSAELERRYLPHEGRAGRDSIL